MGLSQYDHPPRCLAQLLASARYKVLTKEEWQLAVDESFTFQMPVVINWCEGQRV